MLQIFLHTLTLFCPRRREVFPPPCNQTLFFLYKREIVYIRKDLSLSTPFTAQALKTHIESFLDSKKALDIVSIDLQGKSSIADYLVIASGTSQRQVSSMAELLREDLKKAGLKNIHIEGLPQGDWVLVDAGDVIVHIFRPEVRLFYNLEKMWGTVPLKEASGHSFS